MTATIGHNGGPDFDAFGSHVDDLFSTVSGSTASPVTNDEQERALDDLLKTLRQTRKDIDAQRTAEKRPHDEAAKAVQAKFKPRLDKCIAGEQAIKTALTPYRVARQKAKDDAAREAREQAEREQAEARKKLQEADDLEAKFAAEEQLKQSAKLTVAANKIDRAPTGLRPVTIVTVTNHKEALLWIAKRDRAALDEFIETYAKRNAPTRPMDGVDVTEEKRAA